MVKLHLQRATKAKNLPRVDEFKKWISVVFDDQEIVFKKFNKLKSSNKVKLSEVTIRIVDEQEMSDLNYHYRKKIGPTNVLSFEVDNIPTNLYQKSKYYMFGDMVICAAVIEKEALQQNKNLLAHWAHIVIHGSLHLLGYDHQEAAMADEMEGIEIALMHQLGFASPY